MGNFNKVLLMGRLTRDPELRYTPQGVPVTDVGLAVNREFQGTDNERKKDTVFVDATIWRRRAEVVCQYLKKGDPIFLEGRLSMDTWETTDGQRRSKLKVVADNFQFVSGRGDRENVPDSGDGGSGEASSGEGGGYADYEQPGTSASGPPPRQGSREPVGDGAGDGPGSIEDSDIPF
jgi:single-strand DNA-binding protein